MRKKSFHSDNRNKSFIQITVHTTLLCSKFENNRLIVLGEKSSLETGAAKLAELVSRTQISGGSKIDTYTTTKPKMANDLIRTI